MSVVLDTGPLVGRASTGDPHHEASRRILDDVAAGRHGTAYLVDHVFVEAMNLLARRPGRLDVSRAFAAGARNPASGLRWVETSRPLLDEAVRLHERHFARGLSLTDCVVLAQARRLEANVATFDRQFHGLVDVLA